MKNIWRWLRTICIGLPVAWLGGNLVFGVLMEGTWIFYVLAPINLHFAWSISIGALWLARAIVFVIFVSEFRPDSSSEQDARP
jgi:hypothetical protein